MNNNQEKRNYFMYNDTDTYENEIAEIYSYKEVNYFYLNIEAFEKQMQKLHYSRKWNNLQYEVKKDIIVKLVNELKSSKDNKRIQAARAILYLIQGCWDEYNLKKDIQRTARENILILIYSNGLENLINLLNIKTAIKQIVFNYSDTNLILTILNILAETIHKEIKCGSLDFKNAVSIFKNQINRNFHEELFLVNLFEMLSGYLDNPNGIFPIKKLVLLIWKLSLIQLGGKDEFDIHKNCARKNAGLTTIIDDNITAINRFVKLQKNEKDNQKTNIKEKSKGKLGYPLWCPKSRQWDIKNFLSETLSKYSKKDDFKNIQDFSNISPTNIPLIYSEGLYILQKYYYTSLGELQLKNEDNLNYDSRSNIEEIEITMTESLYTALSPRLQNYISGLVKLLQSAIATGTSNNDLIDLCSDLDHNPSCWQEMYIFNNDEERQKEIILKAVSSIILLYLKHFKLNHCLQFECISNLMILENIFIIFLQFLRNDLSYFTESKTSIDKLLYPACVLQTEKIVLSLNDVSLSKKYSWRNQYSCINILRIFMKIVKDKPARLVVIARLGLWKVLENLLKIGNPFIDFYALKLIKIQVKFLGKKWRERNPHLITEIYTKVKQNIHDDWVSTDFSEMTAYQFIWQENRISEYLTNFHNRRYPGAANYFKTFFQDEYNC